VVWKRGINVNLHIFAADEDLEGPYYTHLIAAPSSSAIGRIVQLRLRLDASAVRIEKIVYTGKEGRSQLGCPIAKWIYRRSGPQEKVRVD
jgi:methylcytosine dioxygenase